MVVSIWDGCWRFGCVFPRFEVVARMTGVVVR